MAGDAFNLVDMVRRNLSGDFTRQISSITGESTDRTQLGIDAGVPGMFAALDNSASTAEGARHLSLAVDDADDGILSNIGRMFGGGITGSSGSGTLSTILGSKGMSDLSAGISRASGFSAKSTTTLLGFLAPVVLAVLKYVKRSRNLDAAGLSALLASQRNNFSAEMPEATMAGVGTGSTAYTREPLRDVTFRTPDVEPVRTDTYHRRERSGSSLAWILPLFLLAALVGLIWHFASRSTVKAGRDEGRIAEETARRKAEVGATASFDALKSKYQPVLEEAQAQGIQITNLHQEDGKLVIRGIAPSQEASNKVMERIHSLNPRMDDITANFTVSSPTETK